MNINLKNIKNDIIIGTAQLGTKYGIANKNKSFDIIERLNFLDKIYNKGFKTFDTAYAYKNSHKILEHWIKKRNIELKIYTKILDLQKYPSENINNIFNQSIKSINYSNLEGILLHNHLDWSNNNVKSFILEKLEKKLIKNFGLSIYDLNHIPFDTSVNIIQVPGNIFNQTIINSNELNNFLHKGGMVQIRSIFVQGLLLMNVDEISPSLEDIKKPLYYFHNLARELNTSSFELAILCVKQIFPKAKLVLGFDNIEQLSTLDNIENSKVNATDLKEVIKFGKKYRNKLWDPRYW